MPHKNLSLLILSALLFALLGLFFQDCRKDSLPIPPEVKKLKTWDVFELSLGEGAKMSNPYVEGLKDDQPTYEYVVFNGISGNAEGKRMIIPAFWDGTEGWKIRFSPPFPGIWEYESAPNQDFEQKSGRLEVSEWTEAEKRANPIRRGLIHVNQQSYRPGRYFVYSDGTPFLWIGDTWWEWCKKRILFESFKDLADTRSQQGFTVGQLFFAGRGAPSLLDTTFQHPDIDQIRKVERMIAYANSKGITVWINCWWGSKDLASQVSEVAIRRWWRYAVHRLHAYNVIWVVAGEYNNYNYGGFSLEFWEQLGKLIKTEDPSERIVSSHPTPPLWAGGADAPQWSTAEVIHNQSWMDYNQCQCGHSQSRNHLIPGIVQNAYTKEPAKPIVVTEPWYEFVPDNAPAKEIRFGAWSAILSGAAGHSYGGGHIWLAYLPETPWSDNKWPLDPSFAINTCYYPGAVSIGFLSKYLRQLRWWELEPHPELLPGNSGNFCAARPGKEYLIYLPNGGSQELDLTAASGIFKIERLDLQHNQIFPGEPVSGGQGITLSAADTNDWAIRVYQ